MIKQECIGIPDMILLLMIFCFKKIKIKAEIVLSPGGAYFEKQENASDRNGAETTIIQARNSGRNAGSIKLPKIELPSFSGNYTEWTSFYDLFNASVHSNSSLKQAEKLNYLKSALKGEAFTLVKNLTITDANYENARDILEQRYANKRFIVRMHLDEMLNQGSIKSENGISLRKLLETVQENIAALEAQGCNCNDWGPILLHVLAGKLDVETREQWELQQSGTELQELTDLLRFIDTRARALETIEKNSTKSRENQNFVTKILLLDPFLTGNFNPLPSNWTTGSALFHRRICQLPGLTSSRQ